MDLRTLGEGWDYADLARSDGSTEIINTVDSNRRYRVEGGSAITYGYHPDYTDTFIYKPILPNDTKVLASELLLSLIYPDAKNMNGNPRIYTFDEDVDWRHLIHIMADDWYQHHMEDDYEINLRQNNCWPDLDIDLFPYGRTGYEQYYLDFTSIGGFWQELYDIYSIQKDYFDKHVEIKNQNIEKYNLATSIINQPDYLSQFYTGGQYKHWHKDVIENPERLNFWFDFFKADEMGIGKFATTVIGDRPKTINDSAIKTIIYRDTPDVIYCSWSEYNAYKNSMVLKDGYKYIIINRNGEGYLSDDLVILFEYLKKIQEERIKTRPDNSLIEFYLSEINKYGYDETSLTNFYSTFIAQNIKERFIRSIRGKSVHDQADDMLYQYSYYNDTVNISNVPIYYLQPNTIISIKDELSRVIGYYVMDKINISLSYNGMMQITAVKSPERIY